MKKISLDIRDDFYVRLKKEALEKRVTMSKIIRQILERENGDRVD